jgi:hypothetical protein
VLLERLKSPLVVPTGHPENKGTLFGKEFLMWYVKYRLRDPKSGKTDLANYVSVPFALAKSEASAKTLALKKLRRNFSSDYEIRIVRIYFKSYKEENSSLLAG